MQTLSTMPRAADAGDLERVSHEESLPTAEADPLLQQIAMLRSSSREPILDVLHAEPELPTQLVPHVIPLVAWDPIAEEATTALRKVASRSVGQLIDALVDQDQPFAVRRRLARALSGSTTQRAVDGLLLGLEDSRFEVRFQCGRSLAFILNKERTAHVDADRIFRVVRQEVAVGRPVWESHQLLDRLDDHETDSFVDEFVKSRANRSLAHVFTLISLVLPAEPLQIAFRGLHTNDQNLRGTALEYLESVLPPDIRERLWPFLDDPRPTRKTRRPREEILGDLLRSNQSIVLNLEELKRRVRSANV
jgi:ATP:ADP antiporter, AAA family